MKLEWRDETDSYWPAWHPAGGNPDNCIGWVVRLAADRFEPRRPGWRGCDEGITFPTLEEAKAWLLAVLTLEGGAT